MFSAELSATYTTSGPNNNWHDDLKRMLRHAGEKQKSTVFLFSDTQIIDETMVGAACGGGGWASEGALCAWLVAAWRA